MTTEIAINLDDAPLLHYARRQDVVFWSLQPATTDDRSRRIGDAGARCASRSPHGGDDPTRSAARPQRSSRVGYGERR
jgi:hypothetical protein